MANWQNKIIGLEKIDPRLIIKNPGNYKDHPDLQKRMMGGIFDEIGWIQAVIVNKRTKRLIDGHMRVDLAIENGEEEIPVIYVDMSEEEENKALASFDPIATFAKDERDRLSTLMSKINASNSELSNLVERIAKKNRIDFGVDDIEDAKDKKETKKKDEEDKLKDLVDEWGVSVGQTWEIPSFSVPGKSHRLVCGDSISPSVVEKLFSGSKAKLFVTDPPYGVDFETKYNPKSKDWNAIENDFRKGLQLREWFKEIMTIWLPYIEDDSSFYVWSGIFDEGFAIYYALKDVDLNIQSQIIWNKNAFSLGMSDYHWKHESCWYAFKKGKKHKWYGERNQSTVWDISKVPNREYLHPMQKPVELYAIPMKNHTKNGDICADPFSGSGTQIIAAETNARICYACESDPIWVASSLKRFKEAGLSPELK